MSGLLIAWTMLVLGGVLFIGGFILLIDTVVAKYLKVLDGKWWRYPLALVIIWVAITQLIFVSLDKIERIWHG